jgi:hypothetical protein
MSVKSRFERVDHSLELDESLHVHAAERVAQRIAGLLILAIVVVALLGLFGDGKLAGATVQGEAAILRYDRVLRSSKETALVVEIAGDARVSVPFGYFRDFKLERVVPEPVETRIVDGAALYVFEAASAATLRFHFIPRKPGITDAVLTVNRDEFSVRQLILP